ncbi:MAG: hypothetical protein H8E57_00100 [Candidatus Cloacimonetes bacterium]|nr:hypothetical protein [Candidatus Cloacimonadota bacterium]
MKRQKYTVDYYIEWNDGNTSQGRITFPTINFPPPAEPLESVFGLLFEKVIKDSIIDEVLYFPEMINEIEIEIN